MTREDIQVEVAVLVSLFLHVVSFVGWQQRENLAHWPWLRPLAKLLAPATPRHDTRIAKSTTVPTITFVEIFEPKHAGPPPRRKEPSAFLDTADHQVTGEKPKEADFYSDKSTVASNKENPNNKTGDTPFLNGSETRLASAQDMPRATPGAPSTPATPPTPPQPPVAPTPKPPPPPESSSAPAAKPVEPKTVEQKPVEAKQVETPKELADEGQKPVEVVKPIPELKPVETSKLAMNDAGHSETTPPFPFAPTPATPPAPVAPPSPPSVPGSPGGDAPSVKSRMLAAGTTRHGVDAFNVAESPFGKYDARIVQAVRSRWYALIERYGIYERGGDVTVFFLLYDDGTVKNMSVKQNTAGDILSLYCEKAILQSAPFDPLPDSLRALVGKEPREVNFTFYY